MTTGHHCVIHGLRYSGDECPRCVQKRDEDREWKRQEEQRERDARNEERFWLAQEEAALRNQDAIDAQERIAAEADARSRLAASGVLRASELARNALVALEVGDTATARALVDEALATAPTYAWGYLARALVSKRVAHAAVGPAIDRAVALALASGAPDVEPLPIGDRGPLEKRGDVLAYALAVFGREAEGPARKLLAAGLVSEQATYALTACIPRYADELLADIVRDGVIVKRAAALGIPTDAFRRFAAVVGTWDADVELARRGPPHERWMRAQKLRSWRREWGRVADDLRREIEWRENALRDPPPGLHPPGLDRYVRDAARWDFADAEGAFKLGVGLVGLSVPCICCSPWYLPQGVHGTDDWLFLFAPPIVAACLAVLLVGLALLVTWNRVTDARARARREYPALVARSQQLGAARDRDRAELDRMYGWLAAVQAVG
ncbi:MAG: hypothetical protein M5U28_21075 [Sandaracinaceae bacterium]|nr:hypothetical protein [Sandaracinaceae bacterium]